MLLSVQEWLQKPERNKAFVITRKTELTQEGLAADLELLAMAIIFFARYRNEELQGEGFTITEVQNPLLVLSVFTYKDYNFSVHWLTPELVSLVAKVTIL